MAYDPAKRHGWARGLIHFHTDFSDGGASVSRAAEIVRDLGYDFLILTDHLQDLPRRNRRFDQYVAACDSVSGPDLLVIPGGEIEINWARGTDHSEAHTLAMCVRRLLQELVWSPSVKPYAHWLDSAQGSGTIQAAQEKLQAYDLPSAASHQFQHGYMGTSVHAGEHSDYRYDFSRLLASRLLDFFYSGVVDAAHEPDDFALYLSRLNKVQGLVPAVYASSDYHYGPETVKEALEQHRDEIIGAFCQALTQHFRWLGSLMCGLMRLRPAYFIGVFERWLPWLFDQLKGFSPIQFAAEQLSHTTYVYIGERPLSEDAIVEALREGSTCVTRGAADFQMLLPVPSGTPTQVAEAKIVLDLPKTYSVHRPRNVLIYRDGTLVEWQTIPDAQQAIHLEWTDPTAPKGFHNYVVYVPSKFLSSPMFLEVK